MTKQPQKWQWLWPLNGKWQLSIMRSRSTHGTGRKRDSNNHSDGDVMKITKCLYNNNNDNAVIVHQKSNTRLAHRSVKVKWHRRVYLEQTVSRENRKWCNNISLLLDFASILQWKVGKNHHPWWIWPVSSQMWYSWQTPVCVVDHAESLLPYITKEC